VSGDTHPKLTICVIFGYLRSSIYFLGVRMWSSKSKISFLFLFILSAAGCKSSDSSSPQSGFSAGGSSASSKSVVTGSIVPEETVPGAAGVELEVEVELPIEAPGAAENDESVEVAGAPESPEPAPTPPRIDSSGTNLAGANLSEQDLSHSDFSNSNLSGADLSGADLSGANLEGADLSGATLQNTQVADAHFESSDLSGADASVVTQVLASANINDQTIFPPLSKSEIQAVFSASRTAIKEELTTLRVSLDARAAELVEISNQIEGAKAELKTTSDKQVVRARITELSAQLKALEDAKKELTAEIKEARARFSQAKKWAKAQLELSKKAK
jgi:hypothetical protein